MKKGLLLVISGFSGAGKGTVIRKLLEQNSDYWLSVSMTSRAPREGEQEGVNYYYRSREEFEKTLAEGGLLEHTEYCGNYYGTPKAMVEEKLAAGINVLLEIEVQGALQIKKIYPDSLLLFVTPPSVEELERRLRGRGTETEEKIRKRMTQAAVEAPDMDKYEYVIVNDDLDACAEKIRRIVDAARSAPSRMPEFLAGIRRDLEKYKQ